MNIAGASNFNLEGEELRYLTDIWKPRFYLTVLIVLLAAYLPEIGYTTFSHDYFYDLGAVNSNIYAYTYDGRYLAEAIRIVSGGFLPPTLLLMLGLSCLVGCGIVTCYLFNVRHWLPVTIACCLFATFPMWFEIWSYPSIRLTIPLAALLSLLAMTGPSIFVGMILIFLALTLYQSAIYLPVIVVIYVAALRTAGGKSFPAVLRSFALPRAGIVLGGLILYGVTFLIVTRYFHLGGTRLTSFVHVVAGPDEFLAVAKTILHATFELYAKGVFLFPTIAKCAFLIVTAFMLAILAWRRRYTAILLVLLAPMATFGAAWVMFPPNQMLSDRILFSFVGVYVGTFLTAWSMAHQRVRPILAGLGALMVAVFVLQANNWHQYMDLRNRADMDMTRLIADRIKGLPDYRSGMPVTIVGTLQDTSYLPYRLFDTSRGVVGNSMLASMYAYPWSSTRALMFFFPLSNFPSEEVSRLAKEASADMPGWPAPGSVAIRNEMVVVKLR